MKFLILLLLVFSVLFSCQNQSAQTKIILDKQIKEEALDHFTNTVEFDFLEEEFEIYFNRAELKAYENEKLVFDSKLNDFESPFKSYYFWDEDTLFIEGLFGFFGGAGFQIKYHKSKTELTHVLSADDFPMYGYKKDDDLKMRLEVPCTETKIILSELPEPKTKKQIYGYVEFKSNPYFAAQGIHKGTETSERIKHRKEMKIYFKSRFLSF